MTDTHPSGLAPDPNEPKALDPAKVDDAEAELAREDEQAVAQLRKVGLDDAAIGRLRGRSVEDITRPKRSAADVAREIDELRELRKSNRQKYWAKETQAREAALYAEQEALAAGRVPAKEEGEASDKGNAADIASGELPEALRKEWEKSGPHGLEDALKSVKFRSTMAFHDLDDGGEALRESFDELPDDAQHAVASGLANDAGKWPVASPAEVEEFVALPHGAELVKEWGGDAPKLLGRAKREADYIMARMTEGSRVQMHKWVAGRSAAELKGMVKALATRATRRL